MLHQRVLAWRAANIPQPLETNLRNDSAKLATRRRNTVSSRPITCRKCFTGNDERRRVRPEVLEEVREAVQEHERALARSRRRQFVVRET